MDWWVENAYVLGAARAFIHRAHSGPLGMVNSEEGYQNLTRFLVLYEIFKQVLEVKGSIIECGVNHGFDGLRAGQRSDSS